MATRQVHPSNNPFAVGAVVLDSAPYVDYYIKRETEEKAKRQAYDKYFQDLEGSLSATGMDTKLDLPILDGMRNNWRDFVIKNQDAINTRSDGGKAYMKSMEMFQDMKGLIETSKQKVARLKEINDFRIKNPDAITGDESIQEVDKLRQPVKIRLPFAMGGKVHEVPNMFVDNPAYGDVDMGKFQPVTPLKPDELRAMRKGYSANTKRDINIDESAVSSRDKLMDVVTKKSMYSPKKLESIGMAAAFDYDANRRIRATAQQFNPSPDELASLTAAFKYAFGPDAKITNNRDLYIAQSIADNIEPVVEEKEIKNESRAAAAQEAKDLRMAQYRQGLSDRSAAYRKALEGGEADNWLEGQMQHYENNPTATYSYIPKGGGERVPIKVIGVDAPVKKRFAVDNIEPDIVVQLPDGKYQGIFYAREGNAIKKKDGRFVIEENIIPVTLTRQQVKTALGDVFASGKILTSQLGGAPQPSQPKQPQGQSKFKNVPKGGF